MKKEWREKLAEIEGWEFSDSQDCWIKGDTFAFSDGNHHRPQIPTYETHDDMQRIIDGMDKAVFCSYSATLFDVMDAGMNMDLLRATVEQKREAILKAYGKET